MSLAQALPRKGYIEKGYCFHGIGSVYNEEDQIKRVAKYFKVAGETIAFHQLKVLQLHLSMIYIYDDLSYKISLGTIDIIEAIILQGIMKAYAGDPINDGRTVAMEKGYEAIENYDKLLGYGNSESYLEFLGKMREEKPDLIDKLYPCDYIKALNMLENVLFVGILEKCGIARELESTSEYLKEVTSIIGTNSGFDIFAKQLVDFLEKTWKKDTILKEVHKPFLETLQVAAEDIRGNGYVFPWLN